MEYERHVSVQTTENVALWTSVRIATAGQRSPPYFRLKIFRLFFFLLGLFFHFSIRVFPLIGISENIDSAVIYIFHINQQTQRYFIMLVGRDLIPPPGEPEP